MFDKKYNQYQRKNYSIYEIIWYKWKRFGIFFKDTVQIYLK